LRSDCHLDINSLCVTGSGGTGCGDFPAQQGQSACLATLSNIGAICTWDLWQNKCFNSKAEMSAVYSCSYWSTVSVSREAACTEHGCTWFGNQCYGQTAGIGLGLDSSNVIYQQESVAWVDPLFVPNTDTFGFHTLVPFEVPTNPAFWWTIAIGDDTLGLASNPITPGPCNTLKVTGTSPVSFTFGDLPGLTQEATLWLDHVQSLDFSQYPVGITSSIFIRTLRKWFDGIRTLGHTYA
jgi:hypothetical protein